MSITLFLDFFKNLGTHSIRLSIITIKAARKNPPTTDPAMTLVGTAIGVIGEHCEPFTGSISKNQ